MHTETGAPTAAPADRYLTEKEAAQVLNLSPGFMRKMRTVGGGPVYFALGRAIRYRHDELHAWAQSKAARSTSERVA